MKFNILRIIKLARSYSKAKRLLKKDSPDMMKLAQCIDDLRELTVDLEESKNEFVDEIKKIKDVLKQLSEKIKEARI